MERETKTITTPAGNELIIKAYLTARERNLLRDQLLKNTKVSVDKDGVSTPNMELGGHMLSDIQYFLVKTVAIKYKEITSPDAILETLLESRPDEYDFVVEECNKVNANLGAAK